MKKYIKKKPIFNTYLEKNSIKFLVSDQNYTIIFLKNGSQIRKAKTLKLYQNILSNKSNFARINRSTIVNLDFADSFEIEDKNLFMDDRAFRISRRRATKIMPIIESNNGIRKIWA